MPSRHLEDDQSELPTGGARLPILVQAPLYIVKAYGHWSTMIYRQVYDLLVANGALLHHEPDRR